jgi:regulator of replication initiation timing
MNLQDENTKLKGEIAGLKEKLDKIELESYIDKKLKESKLPMAITKRFRETEACSKAKSQKEIDEKFALFMEGFKLSESKFADTFEDTVGGSEKDYSPATDGKPGFADCAE